jgi:hypothetical protein
MTSDADELQAVRKLLQEAVARAEKAEAERDDWRCNAQLHADGYRRMERDLEDARRELSRLREANNKATTSGG